jgi:hypothetical protein
MTIGQNDVNVLTIQADDDDFQAGTAITLKVLAEVGSALFATGGKYRVRLTLTDITNPALLDSQDIVGNFSDANWPKAGENTFTFTVPAAATNGRGGDLVQPQARLVGNAVPPFDNSFTIGDVLVLAL